MTLYSHHDSNVRKTWALFSIFLIVVIGIGWLLSYLYESPEILYFAVAVSLLMNVVAYWRSDKIALRLSGARKADENSFRELYRIVENLSITAGIPAPKVYVIDDSSPNAFATGRNPQNATVAVTTGLLDRLDRTELEGVIAHELAHVKNYDILLSTMVVVLVGCLSLISDIFLRMSFRRSSGRGGNPVILVLGIVAIILAPIVGVLIKLAISRKREFLADASGALLTRYPEGLASALEKISTSPPLARPREATAHLYFVSPFKADTPSVKTPFLAKFFMTHPPIGERVKALRGDGR